MKKPNPFAKFVAAKKAPAAKGKKPVYSVTAAPAAKKGMPAFKAAKPFAKK